MIARSSIASGFRSDINGLRAWAVVSVVLYHFGIAGFDGGFVGVDLFFVISGFLMTGIVVSGLEQNRFRLFDFYLARARRILPALLVLCAVLLAAGWWLLMPMDYKELATHVVVSVLFLSNVKFWTEAGYFDTSSHEKWLLHTWSLAAEWQFYLLLPLALLAVWKLRPGRRGVQLAMAVALLVSLALSVVLTPKIATAAFYLLPTRAWEMLAGGMAYLLADRSALWTARQRRWLEVAGVALLAGAIAGFDSASPWPGWRALVPVLGTAAILLAARPHSLWTGTAVAQWLGTRSYSLYLWHWPLAVALRYMDSSTGSGAIAACLVLTLVLGDLSYRWAETPARLQLGRTGAGWGVAAMAGAVALLVAPSMAIRMQSGVLGRFTPEIEKVSQEALNMNPRLGECHISGRTDSPSCIYGGPRLRAVVLGDSHAGSTISAVAGALPHAQDGVMEWSYSGCPILQGVKKLREPAWKCGSFVDWSIRQLEKVPKDIPVVIFNRHAWYTAGPLVKQKAKVVVDVYLSKPYSTFEPAFLQEYAKTLVDTVCLLAKDRTVYLVRPLPEMNIHVPHVARAMVWGHPGAASVSLQEYHQRNAVAWAAQDIAHQKCGAKILDPLPYLCPDGQCLGIRNGHALYYDNNHLSERGNKLLVPLFATVFQ